MNRGSHPVRGIVGVAGLALSACSSTGASVSPDGGMAAHDGGAARLGCRQENLSRAFATLRSAGVETHGSLVVLHDIPALRDFAVPDEQADPGLPFSR